MKYWAGLLLIVAACASRVVVDGFSLTEYEWSWHESIIRRQASFDLGCPEPDVKLTVLAYNGDHATNVGATGCDQRVRYVHLFSPGQRDGQWVRQR
jgi:hypothetical protein